MATKKPKTRIIKNTFWALAEEFCCSDPGELWDKLEYDGWLENCKGALGKHVCKQGTPKQLDDLIQRGMTLHDDLVPFTGYTPLNLAIKHRNYPLVEHILGELKFSPDGLASSNSKDYTSSPKQALEVACQLLRRRAVSVLLEHGASPTLRWNNPYEEAAGNGNITHTRQRMVIGIWDLLKKHGVPMDEENTPWSLGHRVIANNSMLLMDWLDKNNYEWRWESERGKNLVETTQDPELRARLLAREMERRTLNNPKAASRSARL